MTYFPEQSFKVLQKQEVIKVGRRPVNICHNYSLVMSLLLPFELLLSVPGSDPSQQNNTTQDPAVAFFLDPASPHLDPLRFGFR